MKRLQIMCVLFGVTLSLLLSCQKEISVESNSNTASFSLLNDSTKLCLDTPAVSGKYYNGVTAALAGNSVSVVVNVKTTGNYVIATDPENGFFFSDSGFFSKTGLTTIVLKPSGKPTLIKFTDFTVGDATCPFTIDVKDSTGTGLGGVDTSGNISFADSSYKDPNPASDSAWHFTDSATTQSYNGIFVTNGVNDLQNSTLTLTGFTTDLSKVFQVNLDLPSGVVKTGVYQFLNSDNSLGLITVSDGTILYGSDEETAALGSSNSYVIITSVTSIDATTSKVQGSFHCWSQDDNGSPATLIKGSFNSLVTNQ